MLSASSSSDSTVSDGIRKLIVLSALIIRNDTLYYTAWQQTAAALLAALLCSPVSLLDRSPSYVYSPPTSSLLSTSRSKRECIPLPQPHSTLPPVLCLP